MNFSIVDGALCGLQGSGISATSQACFGSSELKILIAIQGYLMMSIFDASDSCFSVEVR
jgi:hypothetical protein